MAETVVGIHYSDFSEIFLSVQDESIVSDVIVEGVALRGKARYCRAEILE